jgi:hypothetical protein
LSTAPLVQAVEKRLGLAGYSPLATPFRVAGVDFAFTRAMRGKDGRSLDLILLFDTTTGDFGDRDPGRVRQRVEALSRALDVTGSKYVVTAVLVGAVLADGVEALAETCRVLQVDEIALDEHGQPVDELAERQLDDRVRVLLPLTIPEPANVIVDSSLSIMAQLVAALPSGTQQALIDALMESSERSEDAVTEAAAQVIAAEFVATSEEGLA